jgi:hypothetical protein
MSARSIETMLLLIVFASLTVAFVFSMIEHVRFRR